MLYFYSTSLHSSDCTILLDRLQNWAGICRTAFKLFSFLFDRYIFSCAYQQSCVLLSSLAVWKPSGFSPWTNPLLIVHAFSGSIVTFKACHFTVILMILTLFLCPLCPSLTLHDFAPSFISDLLVPHSTSRPLQSSNLLLSSIPRSSCKTKGDRALTVSAPALWRYLPQFIRFA